MKEKNLTISDIEIEQPRTNVSAVKNAEVKDAKKKENGKIKKIITNKPFLLLVGTLFLTVLSLATLFYSIFFVSDKTPDKLVTFNPEYLTTSEINEQSFVFIPLIEPSEPRTKMNPVNGTLLTEEEFADYSTRIPVAVMMNNHVASRPQSGLIYADIVYEAIAESGITRYMPVYWGNIPEKVGTIRSVRQYYLEWASEYDPVLIHDGYASSEDPRIDAGGNIYRYSIKSISTQGAWRDTTRVAPHNEYSSVVTAQEIAEKKGWKGLPSGFKSWQFGPDAPKDERGNTKSVSVSPQPRLANGGDYDSVWTYDPESNSYLRSTGGSPDLDKETSIQLAAKTVILQRVKQVASGDDKGHNIITTQGEGDAVILMNGEVTNGKWKKVSRTERTMFYDAEGKEIVFNRGLVWITALSTTEGMFDILEQ